MSEPLEGETIAATSGVDQDRAHGSVTPALYNSVNFRWPSPTQKPAFDYARSANPTRAALELALSQLEGAAGGVATNSGMAAIDLTLQGVERGQGVLAPHDAYGGTHRLLLTRAKQFGFQVDFVDQTDDTAFAKGLARNPALVLIETPSNPLGRLIDIQIWSHAAKAVGARVAVDNTLMSPARQKPLDLGADLVIHSTTKFINGHSDVIGGAVLARDAKQAEDLAWWANCTGLGQGAHDAHQTLRGLRTLFARTRQQDDTAMILARHLRADERIVAVHHSGLKSHPQHRLAHVQQSGFGSVFSLELHSSLSVEGFIANLKLFTLAESLGGYESLVCVPATMTHASMNEAQQARAGLKPGLIRVSIGLEHPQDLADDVQQALDHTPLV